METKAYKNHTITLSEDWTRFYVDGPMFEKQQWYTSLSEVEASIDARLAAHAKQKKAENSVSIGALDATGKNITVRGIHAGQGTLLGATTDRVFPVHPTLRDKLARADELRRQLRQLENEVHPYSLNARRGYGRIAPEEYDGVLSSFTEELGQKAEKAKAL